jgi:hypothetical protein
MRSVFLRGALTLRIKTLRSAIVTGSPELFWSADFDARTALAATVVDGFLAVFMFRETTGGVIDLIGLHLEPHPKPMPRIPTQAELAAYRGDSSVDPVNVAAYDVFYQRVREVGWAMPDVRADKGITTTLVRMMTGTPLIAQARTELRQRAPAIFFPDELERIRQPTGAPRRPGTFYATVVERYGELMAEGRGARRRLATERGVSESTVRGWIAEAKRRGLWRTTGRGSPGSIPLSAEA